MNLILLHGAIGASDQLKPLAEYLQKDFQVHCLDFPGHGGREFSNEFSIEHFADEVLAYMDTVGLKNAVFFGYSMGGYVGMYLARHRPARVQRLATLATKFRWDPSIAAREVKMLDPDKIREKVPDFARALEERHQAEGWENVLNRTAGLMVDLGERPVLEIDDFRLIATPTLLLLGENDRMVGLDETEEVCRSLPQGRLVGLPATAHPIEQVNVERLGRELSGFFLS